MIIGHFAAGFAAGSRTPRVPLWQLFIAVQAIDFVWAALILIGVEEARIEESLDSMPLELSFMPFSHGFMPATVGAVLVYLIVRASDPDRARVGAILGLAVFSHWALDLIVHRPDLPLFGDSAKVGFGLWNYEVLAFVVEVVLLLAGLALYTRSRRRLSTKRLRALLWLVGALIVIQAVVVFGPVPTGLGVRGLAAVVLGFYVLVAFAAYRIEGDGTDELVSVTHPIIDLTDEADGDPMVEALVIGTGFGGAISACRLSQRWPGEVVVLERGKRYPLGSFARSPRAGTRNLWNVSDDPHDPLDATPTDDQGLYDLRAFKGLDAVVASGVGGGSLIYSNVFLEPPQQVFEDDRWPVACDRDSLAPYYAVAKEVLGARPVPLTDDDPRRALVRTDFYQQTAAKLGKPSRLVDINVFFGNDHENPLPLGHQDRNRYGALQTSCTYCGECNIGCNVHAKNTVDLNYLYVAEQVHGANVITGALAQRIVPLDENGRDDSQSDGKHGYRVYWRDLDAGRVRSRTTKRVVVSAGTFGTNQLLLRCRDVHETLPALSHRLGEGFSGNGDFISFTTAGPEAVDPNTGPTITQAIDFNLYEDHDPERAFILQDTGYPSALAWWIEGLRPGFSRVKASSRLVRGTAARYLRGRSGTRMGYALSDAISGDYSYKAALLLFMGLDRADGRLELDDRGNLVSEWPVRRNLTLYKAIMDASRQFKKATDAKALFPMPSWLWPARRAVTVHPLGGCRLADSPADGVVRADPDLFGEAYGYRNLFVADGSIVPSAVGANPVATISALSEMVAQGITGQMPTADLAVRTVEVAQ